MAYIAYALVKNLHSRRSNELRFREFSISKIRQGDWGRVREVQEIFPRARVNYGDWVFEKSYEQPSPVSGLEQDIGFGRIPLEVEDTLLLFRLFRVGDIGFSHHSIREPDGKLYTQYPYRALSDVNTVSHYEMERNDCAEWDAFASELPTYESWHSSWFKTARRFFLYGGAKEFNVHWGDVDRIVDYMIALEATLVPEHDFVGRRLRERAALLLNQDAEASTDTKRLIRDFYDIRSAIAHGGELGERHRETLRRKNDFETVFRSILVGALRQLPAEEAARNELLTRLYDVPDEARSEKVFQDYCSISSDEVRRSLLQRLAKRN
jgi:hypothetical protein